jgi:prevent-host-death family protein
MVRQVNIAEAKAKLSELVEAASRGEEIVLARHGKPMARLSPVNRESKPGRRHFGQYEHLAKDIDWDQWWRDWKAMDAEIEADFEASELFPPGADPTGPSRPPSKERPSKRPGKSTRASGSTIVETPKKSGDR